MTKKNSSTEMLFGGGIQIHTRTEKRGLTRLLFIADNEYEIKLLALCVTDPLVERLIAAILTASKTRGAEALWSRTFATNIT